VVAIPIALVAIEVAAGITDIQHVFQLPVARINNHKWRKALQRAGIVDFYGHGLRHTWAS